MRHLAILIAALAAAPVGSAHADARLEAALEPYFDRDGNGLDETERRALRAEAGRIVAGRRLSDAGATARRDVRTAGAPAPTGDDGDKWRSGFLLRDIFGAGLFLDGKDPRSRGGARFSFGSDFATGASTLSASGSLMYGAIGELGTTYAGDYNRRRASRFGVLGGIDFDLERLNGVGSGSLGGRLGMELETVGGGPLPYHYWKLDALYTTDLSGSASVLGLEAKWLPIALSGPIGKAVPLNGAGTAWLRFRPSLDVDFAHVFTPGVFASLVPGRSYLWAGAKADLALFFTEGRLKRFSASARYFYLYDVLGSGRDSINYLRLAARYALNEDETTFLAAHYTLGNEPRTLTPVNRFGISLTAVLGDLK